MTVPSVKRQTTRRMYLRAVRLLSSYIPRFFAAIMWHTVAETATVYVGIVLFSRFLTEATSGADASTLWRWGLLAVAAGATLGIVSELLKRWKEAKWETLYRVADRIVIDRCVTLDYATLDDTQTKQLLRRVRENTQALGRGLVAVPDIFQNLCRGVCGVIGASATACRLFLMPDDRHTWWASPLGAVGLLVCLGAIMAASLWLTHAAQRERGNATPRIVTLDHRYYTMMDVIFDPSKAADVRLYRQDERLVQQLSDVDRAFFERGGIKRQHRTATVAALGHALTAVWFGVVTVFVGLKADGGAFGIGAAVQYTAALSLLTSHLSCLWHGMEAWRINTPYLDTVFACLDVEPRLYRGSLTTEKRKDGDYEWEFRHVTFRYPGQETAALTDVSVTLRAGSRTAIVGENGSGKSTFVKLLCRLYDPDEGEILLNGIDIRKYNYAQYIALVSGVFQDFGLLPQPLVNNVAAAALYDEDRVRACLSDAGLRVDAWAAGIHTPLYQSAFGDGMIPTHGEAQKIAMARALYKDAPLILLDEPTAALDPVAEAAFCEGADRIIGQRTAVYISHRLASCRFCRDILVFDRGRLAERGTHKDLLSLEAGKYRALWESGKPYYQ